jgi:hypothetical protein
MSTLGNGNPQKEPSPLPPITGEMAVGEGMTARQLAAALQQSPYKIVADLIEAGVYGTLDYQIPFDVICKIIHKYGYRAKRTG